MMTCPPTTVLLTEGNLATGPGLLGGIGGRFGKPVGDAVNTGGDSLRLSTTFGEPAVDLPAVMKTCGELGGVFTCNWPGDNLLAGGFLGVGDARKMVGDTRGVGA
jgi:hypothetical protein